MNRTKAEEDDPRAALLVAILGSTMAFLDGTVVNVALPVMQKTLNATVVEMQWVVESYALLLAALVLVGGALGDRLGRKRVFLAGVIVFALSSTACGAAPSILTLILARGVQGIGAALLVPGSLALISAAYSQEKRGRAIGTWSATSAITSAIGPVFGGWLVTHASWRWLFLINVPLAMVVVVIASKRVPETRDDTTSGRIDVLGALLVVASLGAIVYALLDASGSADGIGLARPRVLALLGFGTCMLVAFVIVEARTAHPMMPLTLFRSRTFAGTNLLTLLLYAALGGSFFFIPFNLVQVQGYAPAEAGAALLPMVVLISVMSPFAGALGERFGARLLLFVGPLVVAGGFVLLAVLPTQTTRGGPYWTTFFPGIFVLGVGMGMTVAPLTTAVMASVDAHHSGIASGINNAVSRAAGLLAVAAFGVVLMSRFDRSLDHALDAMNAPTNIRALIDPQRAKLVGADLNAPELADWAPRLRITLDDAFTTGFQSLMLVCGALSSLAALLGGIFVERRHAEP